MTSPIVVVGASAAGTSLVDELITAEISRPIVLIGAEDLDPYHRPALSKQVLTGAQGGQAGRLPAVPDVVDFRRGTRAIGLDTAAQVITVATPEGRIEDLDYGELAIATGATPRRVLPPAAQALSLRTADDAARIADAIGAGTRTVIVGGGFLGLELATAARARGAQTLVIDREPPLQRLFGADVSRLVMDRAERAGVEIVLEAGGVTPEQPQLGSVTLTGGRVVPADVVIEAVGDRPCTDWLSGSGVELSSDGYVLTDEDCRAGGAVVAAGDVRARRNAGPARRTPYWFAALADGRRAAESLLGRASPPPMPTYFWTDVFDISIRAFGSLPVSGVPEVVDGAMDDGSVVLSWPTSCGGGTVAAVNHPMPTRDLRHVASSPRSASTPR